MQLLYVDVPQFSALADRYRAGVDVRVDHERNLSALRLPLINFLIYFEQEIEDLQSHLLNVPDMSAPDRPLVGVTFRFDDRFRTKNVPYPTQTHPQPKFLGGPWAKTPHIYRRFGEWKLVMRIDPKWVTCPGGYGKLRPSAGHRRFTGLCTISALHFGVKRVSAIPLAIGQHVSQLNDLFIK